MHFYQIAFYICKCMHTGYVRPTMQYGTPQTCRDCVPVGKWLQEDRKTVARGANDEMVWVSNNDKDLKTITDSESLIGLKNGPKHAGSITENCLKGLSYITSPILYDLSQQE